MISYVGFTRGSPLAAVLGKTSIFHATHPRHLQRIAFEHSQKAPVTVHGPGLISAAKLNRAAYWLLAQMSWRAVGLLNTAVAAGWQRMNPDWEFSRIATEHQSVKNVES
jgi:hypothetical protein